MKKILFALATLLAMPVMAETGAQEWPADKNQLPQQDITRLVDVKTDLTIEQPTDKMPDAPAVKKEEPKAEKKAEPAAAVKEAPKEEKKAEPAKAEEKPKEEKAADEKKEPKPEDKQETVALGDNRFLIFSGSPGEYEYAYSVDLIKIEGGVPHFEPLFFDEYNDAENTAKLADGMAFGATSYHFDKTNNTLHYTSKDAEDKVNFEYEYKLEKDIFTLEQVTSQEKTGAPKVLFKKDNGGKI